MFDVQTHFDQKKPGKTKNNHTEHEPNVNYVYNVAKQTRTSNPQKLTQTINMNINMDHLTINRV